MKTRTSVAAGASLLVSLTTSALLATAGPAHAVDPSTITVTVVDQFGQPAVAAVQAFDHSGQAYFDAPTPIVSSSHTFTGLPADGYGFRTVGPWSGIECFGISPCDTGTNPAVAPVVTVAAGGTAGYTVHVTVPTISGGAIVGSQLTVQTSAGYQMMESLGAQQSHLQGSLTQQWLRGVSDIPNATSSGYVTVPADAGQQVAVRLRPAPGVAAVFAVGGYTVQPFTTRPVAVTKYATRTKAKLLRGAIRVKVKSAPGVVPDGKAKLSLGPFKTSAKLKRGRVTVDLPKNLAPGTYTLKASYPGSALFEKSKSKKLKVVIH